MVSNLLVVLCGDQRATPVVNTGSLTPDPWRTDLQCNPPPRTAVLLAFPGDPLEPSHQG
jgi:hypothetical protein